MKILSQRRRHRSPWIVGASAEGARSASTVKEWCRWGHLCTCRLRFTGQPSEEQAILDLIEEWGQVDRSHRKLAHRGSYTGVVFVAPSTLLRVALKHQVTLPGEPFRPRPVLPALPEVPWERNRIWIWDCSHFTRAKRVAYAIIDVV